MREHFEKHVALSLEERHFATGWARMVDLFAAADWRTDLERIAHHGGALPSRMLRAREDFADLPKAERAMARLAKYKVTLGIMPDYQDYGDGLHIAGVMDGRTAHNAGIKDGDIITKIGKCPIKEVYSYMDCLATFNAGDETTVDLLRDGKKLTVKIKF